MKLAISNICTAFNYRGSVGSRVYGSQQAAFLKLVEETIEKENVGAEVMVLHLPDAANEMARCGQGRIPTPASRSCFVVREYRGHWSLYLHSRHAAPTKGVSVVIYTRHEYHNDPDSTPEENERTKDADYVIVAVLATPFKERPPYGSTVLVHNIAGGNNAFKPNLPEEYDYSMERDAKARLYDWFVSLAKATEAYEKGYKTVADPEE